jgi:magnesium transporter
MSTTHSRRSLKAGLPPGTLVHQGRHVVDKATFTVINYNEDNFKINERSGIEECFSLIDTSMTTWINIDGVSDPGTIDAVGAHFGLHPLLLEDIMNTDQRPKLDDYEDHLFLVLKMILINVDTQGPEADQVSFVLGENYLITFLERPSDVFLPAIDRLHVEKSRIRKNGPDYLLYTLVDIIVDNYFAIMDKGSEILEDLETKVIAGARTDVLIDIQKRKRDFIFLRKSIAPLRDVLLSLERNDTDLISPSLMIFFRDIADHSMRVIDNIETSREMLSGMLDIYLSSVSNRLNEVMKVLTIISTIFIPLTFIAGVYGMNFENLPEKDWYYGYYFCLSLMGAVVVVMLMFFRKKKWI